MPRIQANRDTIDDRFSVLGFTVRCESPLFEVAVATDPNLFKPENRGRRARANFYSSRAQGVMRARRGEAVYLLPPDVLSNFVGQPRLYFGLATYRENSRGAPDYVQAPSDGSMYVSIGALTERGLRRSASAQIGSSYGQNAGRDASLDWGGDATREATTAAVAATRSANATTPSAAPATAVAAGYDDGFGAFPEEEPVVGALDLVRSYNGGLLEQLRFFAGSVAWFAGVSNTRDFPHSAICQVIDPSGGPENEHGTAFYIGRNLLLTAAHVVDGMNSLVFVPGKSGQGTGTANEPFGRFTVAKANWKAHERYTGSSHDFDFAIVKTPNAAPNGRWFNILEELTQSRPEGVTVCGYSVVSRQTSLVARLVNAAINTRKQHLHGGFVRTVGNETFTYDIQTLAGASGSPVYWIENSTPPKAHMVGVHVSGGDDVTNQGCRLTAAKIAWIRARAAEWGQASAMELDDEDMAQAFAIPLDPGAGGRSVGQGALKAGDIIVSTTRAFVSRAIRLGTISPVSHVMLYVGDGKVIEAVGSGVREVTLATAIDDAILAVAYRHPQLDTARASAIVAHARSRVGNPYNYAGVAFQGYRILNPLPAVVIDAIGRRLGVEVGQANAVYCSELVLECFERAGLSLTAGPRPAQSTPDQVVQIARSSLSYVGHLKAEDVPLGIQLGMADAGDVAYDPTTGKPAGAPAEAMVIGPQDVARAQRYAPEWRDLYNWSVPAAVASGVASRGFSVQRIADAHGELNLDKYEVRVTQLPNGYTAQSLLEHVRRHLNEYLDTRNSEFVPYATGTDDTRWASASPVGTVHKIDIAGPKNAAVVTGLHEPTRWRFTTVTTPWSGAHPVSGHREFGVRDEQGASVIYTRAADRATSAMGETLVWLGADQLWRSFQTKVSDWVNRNGGAATIVPRFSERFHPEVVRILYGTPTAQSLTVDDGSDMVFGDALAERVAPATPADEVERPAAPPAVMQQPLEVDEPIAEAKGGPAVVQIGSAVAGAVFTRLLDDEGDISWELDQMSGLKHPNDQAPNPLPPFRDGTPVRLVDWPYTGRGDNIHAGFEIRWQYNGTSLGNVQISNISTNDAIGWGLTVKGRIMNDSVVYPRNAPKFAALRVRLEYRFSRVGPFSDQIAFREVHLFGNGTYNTTGDWTQNNLF